MTQRARFWIGCAAAVLVVAGVIGVSARQEDGTQLRLSATQETTTTIEDATTTTSSETSTTAVPTSSTTGGRVRPVVSSIVAAVPTVPLKPLTLSRVRITVGTPCSNPTTTTTGPGGSIFELDGCWLFVYWPGADSAVRVRLVSDRGMNQPTISGPCQTYEGECHAYIGPVFDRSAGERECFWLVTADAGWVPLSNRICVDWPERPEIAQSPA